MKLQQPLTGQVFIAAFRSLPDKDKTFIYNWIVRHKDEVLPEAMTETNTEQAQWLAFSDESMNEIWDTPENEVWDKFYQESIKK